MNRNNHIPRLAVLLLSLILAATSWAQTTEVTGTVTDKQNGETLIGVTVKVVGQNTGVITDFDGHYIIIADAGATLEFTYMGYKKHTERVAGRRQIDISMVSDTQLLDELVIIGYGVQKKSDITGSISSIAGKDVNNVPVSSALQALQGRAAGVNVIQNTGAPGGKTTIKVRGTGTVNDADPLYVVDGFVVDNIDYLNPNDIENVEIFKDAASSAIYGSRAANGVVVITTKSGKEGKTRVTYDGYFGFSNPWKTIDVMGLEDYTLMRDYISGRSDYSYKGQLYMSPDANGTPIYDEKKYHDLDTIRHNRVGNYWDAITRTGTKQQHAVSVSGGNDKLQYLVSASYFNEKGIVKTSDYQRLNTRMNVKAQLTKWLTMTTNMSFTADNRNPVHEGGESVLRKALQWRPNVYAHNNVGYYYEEDPVAIIDRDNEEVSNQRFDMNISLDARLLKGLTYQFKASYYNNRETNENFYEYFGLNEDFVMPTTLTEVYKRQNNVGKWEVDNLLTWMLEAGKHSLTVLGGQVLEGYKYDFQESHRKGTPSNEDVFRYLSSAYTGDKTYGLPRDWTAIGWIGRINYSFDDTYLLQANIRADGSSKFSKDNRWGVFPSVSVGWKFSNLPALKSLSWLSLGKLRIGWGLLGNNRIDEMARYTYLSSGYNYPYGVGNHTLWEGSTATVLGNDDIKWEKSESKNIGIDFSFLSNRLMLTVEYFNRKTTDMLLRVPTVLSAGLNAAGAPMTNAGAVKNYGLEYDVKWRDNIGKNFRYEVGFNLSWIKNEVTSLGTGNEPVWGNTVNLALSDPVTKTVVGQPIGAFYGYVTDGIFQTFEEVRASAQYDFGKNYWEQTTKPGDFRFKDLNGDGKITAEDRTFLGSPLPKFVFGIPMAVGYKNFDLNIFFQGQTGNKVFNVMDNFLYNAAGMHNVSADLREKHWSGQLIEGREFFPLNTDASIPDLRDSDPNQNFRASDFFVHDGSYVRLKEMRLTWTMPEHILQKIGFSSMAISLTGYNLLTFTSYNGFDPEVGRVVGTEGNNLNMGVDYGNYPQTRSFTLGLKFGL